MDADTLDRVASPQGGIITRADLLAAGWSRSRVDRARRSGELRVLAPGVFRVAGAPWTRRAAHHAAILIAGENAHLARWTAAELHGFGEQRPGPIDVTVPRGRIRAGSHPSLLRVKHTRSLPDPDRCRRGGLPVTSGARTLLDLAPRLSVARLAELTAAALREKCCRACDLHEILARRHNVQGRGRLREAVDLLGDDGADARAEVEIAALHALVGANLPRPVVAYRVRTDDGLLIAEVDLAYPAIKLAIEIDGYRWHSSPARKLADEQRQNRLILAGWTVLRFSAADVRRHPGQLVTSVSAALAAAGVTR
jgi:very-short-patch-repair endonuclease/predicted transcriptional regulator of viral defense system